MGNNKEIQRQQYNRTVAMLKQYRDAQFFLQHTTDEESKQRTEAAVTIVGRNEAGFSFTFAKDAESTIEPQFKAHPMDKDGTLLIFDEDIVTEA